MAGAVIGGKMAALRTDRGRHGVMWSRFTLEGMRVVFHCLGILVCFLAAAMLVPLIAALCTREFEIATHYFLGAAITFAFGVVLVCFKVRPARLTRKQAIATAVLAWLAFSALSAIPLYLSGHYASVLDVVFESVSGLTNTGLTMVEDLEHLSYADGIWRVALHLIGGQGAIIVALGFGMFNIRKRSLPYGMGDSEHIIPQVRNAARFVGKTALVVIAVAALVLTVVFWFQGLEPASALYNGLVVTISAYDTGGFMPHSLSATYYQSWLFEIVVMVIMFLGTLNFMLYARVRSGNVRTFFENIEVRTLAGWCAVLMAAFAAVVFAAEYIPEFGTVLRRGVFTVVSAVTGTGFSLFADNQIQTIFSSGAFFVVILAMATGGCTNSTAGGIKALRVGIVVKSGIASIQRILLPENAQVTAAYHDEGGRHVLTREESNGAMVVFSLYCASMVIGALVAIVYGYDAISAIFESVSTTANVGLSTGIVSATAPSVLKVVYIIQMLLGRLEFLPLLAFLVTLVTSALPHRWTVAGA